MRDVKLIDPYGSMTIRMCEKHFSQYKGKLARAMEGGTSYTFSTTNKRGCEICKKGKKS